MTRADTRKLWMDLATSGKASMETPIPKTFIARLLSEAYEEGVRLNTKICYATSSGVPRLYAYLMRAR